jgi:hypothetical protein
MRVSLTAAMAASVVAIGLATMQPAHALPREGGAANPSWLQTVGYTAKPGHVRRHGRKRGPEDPAYGFVASCHYLRGRALATNHPAWWRKYRACVVKP